MQGEGSGFLFNLDKVGPVEQATTSFGQGVSVTPIQQVARSMHVNGGTLYQPYIAKEFIDPKIIKLLVKRHLLRKEKLFPRKLQKSSLCIRECCSERFW